ncbi:hypothetical protein [Microvirga arabica]|uniref:hypothetical protein n=1 Tax=Microvirga arabica TaxID=1128671 RepID=UPI00193936CC|nr:hypothetical protein [Microvirga arabica]MBM1175217.1 hypothetical protein [Microvirga arabica]
MSRKREFGKKYSWGSERPALAMANALKRKEKLLQKIEEIRVRKRQEEEQEIAETMVKIEESDLVMALVTEYQTKRSRKHRKLGSHNHSEAQMNDIKSQHPGIPNSPDLRIRSVHQSEALVKETTLSSSDTRVKLPHQSACTFDEVASGADRVWIPSDPSLNQSIKIKAAASDPLLNKAFGKSASESDSRQYVTVAEQKLAQFELTNPAEGGNCLLGQDERQHQNHKGSIDKQRNETEAVDCNPTLESQKLMKQKRDLEGAFDDFCHRFGEDQSEWPAEEKAEADRLDQELTAISILLDSALASRTSVS